VGVIHWCGVLVCVSELSLDTPLDLSRPGSLLAACVVLCTNTYKDTKLQNTRTCVCVCVCVCVYVCVALVLHLYVVTLACVWPAPTQT
jgi:hypothetical protein